MTLQGILDFSVGSLSVGGVVNAAVLLVICLIIIKFIMKMVDKVLSVNHHIPPSFYTFIRSGMKVALYFVTVLIVTGSLGIETSSLLAVSSLVGVASSLARQNSLSNLPSGVLLLVTKPFEVGNFVDAAGVSGTVAEIGLIHTRITTPNNEDIFVPNSEISAGKVTNYSSQKSRRINIAITASYDSPVDTVKNALLQAVERTENVLADPAPFIRLSNYKDSSIEYTVRVWANNSDYWAVYFDLLENISVTFEENDVEMTYNHLNIHMIEDRKKES